MGLYILLSHSVLSQNRRTIKSFIILHWSNSKKSLIGKWGIIMLGNLRKGSLEQGACKMVLVISFLGQGWGMLAGLQAMLPLHSLVLLVRKNKGLQSWSTQPDTHQRREDRLRVSSTGKKGTVKKSYFYFNCIFFIPEILLFHTSSFFVEMVTYLGFLEDCTVCLLAVVSICVQLALLTFLVLQSFPKIKVAFIRTGETPCWTRSRFLGFVLMLLAVNV